MAAALAVSQDDRTARRHLTIRDPEALDRAKHALDVVERIHRARSSEQDD